MLRRAGALRNTPPQGPWRACAVAQATPLLQGMPLAWLAASMDTQPGVLQEQRGGRRLHSMWGHGPLQRACLLKRVHTLKTEGCTPMAAAGLAT